MTVADVPDRRGRAPDEDQPFKALAQAVLPNLSVLEGQVWVAPQTKFRFRSTREFRWCVPLPSAMCEWLLSGCHTGALPRPQWSERRTRSPKSTKPSSVGKKTPRSAPLQFMGLTIFAVTRPTDSSEREAAFERLVILETTRLYRIALAIVDDPGEAEDVVQETIIIAWRRWPTLQAVANPSGWLTRVCIRECVRRRRFLRRRTLWTTEQWAAASSQNQDFTGPMLDLHRAYRHLSASQRAVVTLHLRDGLTVNECAALLGIRPGTARSHLGRGLNKLRRELKDA